MVRDISIAVDERTPEWPGDTPFSCGWPWQMSAGASVNVSTLTMSPHVGTHADAPLHIRDGWAASHELPLDVFMGRAFVCSVSGPSREVELTDLQSLPEGRIERLLLRTGRTIVQGTFPEWWPALSTRAVAELLGRGLQLLGVDAPSVDLCDSKTLEVHHALFTGGAYNLENLDLGAVQDGAYELVALPLRVRGLDAAPTRAVLRAI
jgi:arylformamidase